MEQQKKVEEQEVTNNTLFEEIISSKEIKDDAEKIETIDKKLHCYTVESREDLKLIFRKLRNKINGDYKDLEKRGLIFSSQTDGFKYFLDVREEKIFNRADSTGKLSVFNCILYKLRENDFPYLFNLSTGKKSTITANIKDTLMEQTHFSVFADINIIISEYNYYGASVSKLIFIIDKVLGHKDSQGFKVNHILDAETAERIRNLKEIDRVQFKAGHQGLKSIGKQCDIGGLDVLCDTFENSSELDFEVIIKGKGRGENKSNFVMNNMEKFKEFCLRVNSSKDKKNLDIQNLKIVDSESTAAFPIDLFQQYLVAEVTTVKLSKKVKYIDSEDMFEKILWIYNSNGLRLSSYVELDIIK